MAIDPNEYLKDGSLVMDDLTRRVVCTIANLPDAAVRKAFVERWADYALDVMAAFMKLRPGVDPEQNRQDLIDQMTEEVEELAALFGQLRRAANANNN
jgi:hypothetical protein